MLKINYRETNNAEAVDNLLYNGFDLGIVRYTLPYETDILTSLERKDLNTREIWKSEYVLLMSKFHPLADSAKILLKDLKKYPELIHGDDHSVPVQPYSADSSQIALYERGSPFDFLRNVPATYMWVSPVPSEILEKNELVQKNVSTALPASVIFLLPDPIITCLLLL